MTRLQIKRTRKPAVLNASWAYWDTTLTFVLDASSGDGEAGAQPLSAVDQLLVKVYDYDERWVGVLMCQTMVSLGSLICEDVRGGALPWPLRLPVVSAPRDSGMLAADPLLSSMNEHRLRSFWHQTFMLRRQTPSGEAYGGRIELELAYEPILDGDRHAALPLARPAELEEPDEVVIQVHTAEGSYKSLRVDRMTTCREVILMMLVKFYHQAETENVEGNYRVRMHSDAACGGTHGAR